MGRESHEHEGEQGPVLVARRAGSVSPRGMTSGGVMIAHEANEAKVPLCSRLTKEHAGRLASEGTWELGTLTGEGRVCTEESQKAWTS
jgi:hypothetical protein